MPICSLLTQLHRLYAILLLLSVSLKRDDIAFRMGTYRAITCLRDFSGQIARGTQQLHRTYRMHRIARPGRTRMPLVTAPTRIRTHTRISSRNSAVHFYYLPFYGRKSLPHADSRCAEGRRAIAKGGGRGERERGWVKTSRVHGSLVCLRQKRGWGTYVRFWYARTRHEFSFLVKRECRVLEALRNKAQGCRIPIPLILPQ